MYSVPSSLVDVVSSWTKEEVMDWLRGLDDCVLPSIHYFDNADVTGSELLMMNIGDLQTLGITSFGVRQVIMQAIDLLLHLCYKVDTENLQTLTLGITVRAKNLLNDLTSIQERRHHMNQRDVLSALSSICTGVSSVAEEVKRTVSWLDRSPFDHLQRYANVRNRIMDLTLKLLKTTQVPTADMLTKAKSAIICCNYLNVICDEIVKLPDSLVLSTAFLDRAVIKRTNPEQELGLNLVTSYRGVHMVSEVKFQSAADLCGKIDAGDEIVQINKQTVVGWDLRKLVAVLKSYQEPQIKVLLKRRPRDSHVPLSTRLGIRRYNMLSVPTDTVAISDTEQEIKRNQSAVVVPSCAGVKLRRRSSSMHEPLTPADKIRDLGADFLNVPEDGDEDVFEDESSETGEKQKRQRRATVSGGSPTFKRITVHLNRQSTVCPRPQSNWLRPNTAQGQMITEQEEPDDDSLRRKKLRQPASSQYRMSYINNELVTPQPMDSDSEEENADIELFDIEPYIDEDTVEVVSDSELQEMEVRLRPSEDEWSVRSPALRITMQSMDYDRSTMEQDSEGSMSLYTSTTTTASSLTSDNPLDDNDNIERLLKQYPDKSRQKIEYVLGHTPSATPPASGTNTPRKKMSTDVVAFGQEDDPSVILRKITPLPSVQKKQRPPPLVPGSVIPSNNNETPPVTPQGPLLQHLVHTPCCFLENRKMSGWVKKMEQHHKWLKRYLVLVGTTLYIYNSEKANGAEGVLALPGFTVCPSEPEFKTTKKHVFKIENKLRKFYFACNTHPDMITWLNRLGLAAIEQKQSQAEGDFYLRSESDVFWDVDSPRRRNIFGTGPRLSRESAPGSPLLDFFRKPKGKLRTLSRENSVGSSSLNSWHSEGEGGTLGKEIIDPLKPVKKRRPIPPEYRS